MDGIVGFGLVELLEQFQSRCIVFENDFAGRQQLTDLEVVRRRRPNLAECLGGLVEPLPLEISQAEIAQDIRFLRRQLQGCGVALDGGLVMSLAHLHRAEIVPGFQEVGIGTEHTLVGLLGSDQVSLVLELNGTLKLILKRFRPGLEAQEGQDEQQCHCTILKSAAASVASPLSWSSKVKTSR